MGRNKNKKVAKKEKAIKAQVLTEEAAKSSMETSETSPPVSYADAASNQPAEETKAINNVSTVPIVTVDGPVKDPAVPPEHAESTSASPNIFEDDAIEVDPQSTPTTKSGNELGISIERPLYDSPESEFSLLKKEENSQAGSPGELLKKTIGNGPSTEDPFTYSHEHEGKNGRVVDYTAEAKTPEAGKDTNTKESLHSSCISRELRHQRQKNKFVTSISKAEWDKTFDSGIDGKEDTAAVSFHPAVTENHRLARIIDEQEAALYESRVLLQDRGDQLEEVKKVCAKLHDDRDRWQKELHEAHETLQNVHERRQKLQNEKDKHRLREADWEKEKHRLETKIDQLNKTLASGSGDGNPYTSPPPPGDDPGKPTLKDETIKELQSELNGLRDELKQAQDGLNALRIYKKRKEDQKVVRAKMAACETENEKLEKYGGTLDRESQLYQSLKKLADFHDGSGPDLTAGEYAQIRAFKICFAERRRIMAQASTHSDPRGFMTPYLEKWDGLALAGGCTFIEAPLVIRY
ncbi:hypothetical protein N0V93_000147 [Gnomoniopsis smithogilvyi]|uniref:Uncharacterized protein n=1 Tax=Gnomoniopsis smithogilvyi TaxID=1191159 RepID=A0A9W9D1G4_9PEZI|nr:hypothetical protein N0V93_000147 [Gnomoniopsis smithogilvyi]